MPYNTPDITSSNAIVFDESSFSRAVCLSVGLWKLVGPVGVHPPFHYRRSPKDARTTEVWGMFRLVRNVYIYLPVRGARARSSPGVNGGGSGGSVV